jgi:tetratricopeptide (TPR) repeat protein
MEIALYIAAVLLLVTLLWSVIGVLHEAGHALAALTLLPGPVTVHLGTYGQPTQNLRFQVGRLRVFIAYTVLRWRGGYCECPTNATAATWRQVLFIVAGPLFPLLLAGAGAAFAFAQPNYPLRALACCLLGIASISFFFNLVPRAKPVLLADGSRTFNDGQQLVNIYRQPKLSRRLHAQLQQAEAYRVAGNYSASADIYLGLLPTVVLTASILQHAYYTLTYAGRYDEALPLSKQYQEEFADQLTDDDRFTHGLILSRLGQHPAAIDAYTALIEQAQPYLNAYNNRGYTHNLLGNYALALADFDQAIAREPEQAYAYNNRGLALLKLGQEAAGLADIQHGLALDPANAYGYRNLGIYHLDRGEYPAALRLFEQAQELDSTTHELSTYLQKTHQHLAQRASTSGPLP